MAVYRYILFNPTQRQKPTSQKFSIVPRPVTNLPMVKTRSPNSTDTEHSDHEQPQSNATLAISNEPTRFDPSLFFDFQSYDYHQSQQSYDQYRAHNNISPYRFPRQELPVHNQQQFPAQYYQQYGSFPPQFQAGNSVYPPFQLPMMTYKVNQAAPSTSQPPANHVNYQSQPRSQPFHPVIYTAQDINNNMNKRKRVSRGPRSDSGCYVCRLRHLKCDEHHPRCIRCDMIGIKCEYPDRNNNNMNNISNMNNKRVIKPEYMVNEEAKRLKLNEIKSRTAAPRCNA